MRQVRLTHATVPLAGEGQGWQRSPQVARVLLETQRSAQRWVSAGQVKSQTPTVPMRLQRAVAPIGATQASQRVPHEAGLLSARHCAPHRWVPAAQGATHRPSVHWVPVAQDMPQPPQWALSTRLFTQPTAGQYDCGDEQVHAPSRQNDPAAQAMPHRPQWSESLRVSTQRSLQRVARSAGHWQAPPRQLRPEPVAPQGVSAGSSS